MSNTNELGFKAGACGWYHGLMVDQIKIYDNLGNEIDLKATNSIIYSAAQRMQEESKYLQKCPLQAKFTLADKHEFFQLAESFMPGLINLRDQTLKNGDLNRFCDFVEFYKISWGKEFSNSRKHDEMLERQAEAEREQLKLKNWKDFGFKPPVKEEKKGFFSKLFAG